MYLPKLIKIEFWVIILKFSTEIEIVLNECLNFHFHTHTISDISSDIICILLHWNCQIISILTTLTTLVNLPLTFPKFYEKGLRYAKILRGKL